MSTEQERSFIATIRCDNVGMLFFGQLRSHSTFETPNSLMREGYKSNLVTSSHIYSDLTKKMVQLQKGWDGKRTLSDDLIVYCRCYEDYYNIQIRSGGYSGHYLSKSSDGFLGAFPGAGGNTTSFNLLNSSNSIITLDDLKTNEATVFLKARNAGIVKRRLHKDYSLYAYGDTIGDSVKFNLEILERNVPYPSSNDPYLLYVEPRPSDDEWD